MRYTTEQLINNVCENNNYRSSEKNYQKVANCGLEPNQKIKLFKNYSVAFFPRHGGIEKVFFKGSREVRKSTVIKNYEKYKAEQ